MAAPTALTLLTRRKRLEMLTMFSITLRLCPGLRPLTPFREVTDAATTAPDLKIRAGCNAARVFTPGGGRLSWLALNAPQVSMKRDGDHHSTAALPLAFHPPVPGKAWSGPGPSCNRRIG